MARTDHHARTARRLPRDAGPTTLARATRADVIAAEVASHGWQDVTAATLPHHEPGCSYVNAGPCRGPVVTAPGHPAEVGAACSRHYVAAVRAMTGR